jgi:hypothetical protein
MTVQFRIFLDRAYEVMEFIDSGEFKVRLYFAPEAVAYRGDASNV